MEDYRDQEKDKKILFLSVQTFNYEKAIADKLRTFGAQLDYFDERPANSIFVKGIIRFKRSLYQKKIKALYQENEFLLRLTLLNKLGNQVHPRLASHQDDDDRLLQ